MPLPTLGRMTIRATPLTDRVAVVTGAASGIGAATARTLIDHGARVVLVARRGDRLSALAEQLGCRAVAAPADITDPDAVDGVVAQANSLGPVDLLVNNAGVMLANPLTERRDDEWQRMIGVNLTGILNLTRAFLPDLLSTAASGRAADIVNVSSTGADVRVPGFAVYGATKAAISYLSAALRAELAGSNLRITDIKPGGVRTELAEHTSHPRIREQLRTAHERMRLLGPGDVAEAIVYAVTRPPHVCLSQLTVMPVNQAQ